MSLELGVPMGEYHHYATSLHIYEHNIVACKNMAQEQDLPDGYSPKINSKQDLVELAETEASIRLGDTSPYRDGPLTAYVEALLDFRQNVHSD
ncbi:hypothetical protein GCM10010837_04990 [Aminobacter niigataensis]